MSRTGDEEEEEEECFHDSLDRLLSSTASSCSSSSPSDDEGDKEKDPVLNPGWSNYAQTDPPLHIPNFPMGVYNNYDLWITEPSSVQERRVRLLRQMGLTRDASLSRLKPSTTPSSYDDGGSVGGWEFGRSSSPDRLNRNGEISCSTCNIINGNADPAIIRSRSDGVKDHNRHHQSHKKTVSASSLPSSLCKYNSLSVYSSEILSVNSHLLANKSHHDGVFVDNTHNDSHSVGDLEIRSENGSPVTSAVCLYKPPSGRSALRSEDSNSSLFTNPIRSCNSTPLSGAGTEVEDSDSNGVGEICNQVCTIRNLDDGKEFVVNEIREDGMWNKLKEVSTGRQLTMEEFEMFVGRSPIVQELMRRQSAEDGNRDSLDTNGYGSGGSGSKTKRRPSWLKSIRDVASSMTGYRERRSSDEKDTSSEKGGRRSSSATDDSQDVSYNGSERTRVRQYGKSCKDLTAVYKIQELHAHNGSIWTIKFSLDGKYLASAGEDCYIHVWQVVELQRKGEVLMDKQGDGHFNFSCLANGSPEPMTPSLDNHQERKRRGRSSTNRKSASLDHVVLPDAIFSLTEKPMCSLQGHLDVVLDLSWSMSQELLSSSMDKTVRLWHLPSKACLKIFSHSDYVTCIQFNPVDDRYFISGSLDAKVRIWSIPDRQVVDWIDLHEMVTAACYTPDGQGALVGSYKGSCHLYGTSDNKLQHKNCINLQNKKKKSHHKKITGFQFAPGCTSEVLVTSADSRIRVIDGIDLTHKFKGFRNTNSQIAASFTSNGKYVVSASEDSHIYVWKHEGDSRPSSRSKSVTVTQSYEYFHCQDVSMAIPWPGICDTTFGSCSTDDHIDNVFPENHPPTPVEDAIFNNSPAASDSISKAPNGYFFDRISATWPEEKLVVAKNCSPHVSSDFPNDVNQNKSAWGLVIVAAGLRGEIRTFQNFGLPVRL